MRACDAINGRNSHIGWSREVFKLAELHFGQNDALARNTLASETLARDTLAHRRQKCEHSSSNPIRPVSYVGSIWELYVLDLKTKFF